MEKGGRPPVNSFISFHGVRLSLRPIAHSVALLSGELGRDVYHWLA